MDCLKSVTVSKRVFIVGSRLFWIVDFGNATYATFNYITGTIPLPEGVVPVGQPPGSLPFLPGLNNLEVLLNNGETLPLWFGPTDTFTGAVGNSSYGVILDSTMCFDPFVSTQDTGIEAFRSYSNCKSLLQSGTLTVLVPPFPVTNAIGGAVKVSAGIRSKWSTQTPVNQISLSATNSTTHSHKTAFSTVFLPGGSDYRIRMSIPNFSINGAPYEKNGKPAAYFWSGLATGLTLVTTSLGTLATT